MNSNLPKTRRRKEAGYTLLMAVFLVATMIIAASASVLSVLTEGRREKEADMVWRGEQYERAIGLYYKKFGKYPTKIEDLTRNNNGVRFLRKAYTDPMNKDDGSWRFIYVGPNGQLIGSLRQSSLLQTTTSMPGIGGASSLGGGLLTPSGPGGLANQQTGIGAPGQQTTNTAASANPLESQPQPLEGAILGGNIIGVGSKIKKPSIRVYLGGDTYQKWEFIWNPTGLGAAVPGQAPVNPNANPSAAPNGTAPAGANSAGANAAGANPTGANPPDGQQPQQNPQTPVVNPPPSQ
jgi:hypothetical protein